MDVRVNKLFNGFVSVRDNIVKKCVAMRQDLVIFHDGKRMIVPYEKIKDPDRFQIHKTVFKSKYQGGGSYQLYDFKWNPTDNGQQKLI